MWKLGPDRVPPSRVIDPPSGNAGRGSLRVKSLSEFSPGEQRESGELHRVEEIRPIVFRHLSPAAFCKRLVLTVDSTVNCCDHSEKSNCHQHLDRLETIEWE